MAEDWFENLKKKVEHFFATATKEEIMAALDAAKSKRQDDTKVLSEEDAWPDESVNIDKKEKS